MKHGEAIRQVNQAVTKYVNIAQRLDPECTNVKAIMSTRKSTTAGKAYVGRVPFGVYEISLNIPLLAVNNDPDQIDQTVGHEIAHLIAYKVYGDRGHGASWKKVMRYFGLAPERCHDMSKAATTVGKNTTIYVYRCTGCGKHVHLGAKRHKKQQQCQAAGSRYGFFHCGKSNPLEFVMQTDKKSLAAWKNGQQQTFNTTENNRRNSNSMMIDHEQTHKDLAASRQQQKNESTPKKGTKIDRCRELYKELSSYGYSRKAIIQEFVEQINMTPAGAATYYAKVKN